jgi:putative ABC transport system permease protein
MIQVLAWRNMWRNKLRSSIIIAAVTIGVFAGIFILAFLNGMINSRVDAVISAEMSHIQLHQPGFLDNNQLSLRFSFPDTVLEKLYKVPYVKAVSRRIVINSMVASAEAGAGVKITGIDADNEQRVSSIHSKLIEGEYLSKKGRNPVVISERLAEKLKVGLRNKIIITVQDDNKNITGGAFRIVGIYRTDNLMFDEANVFVRNSDIARLTGISETDAHEVAVLLNKNEDTEAATRQISELFPSKEVKNWLQLSPDAGALVGAMNQYTFVFTLIILIALCFGIINTMLMVIMERMRELGMIMAIGMNQIRVFFMIMLETVFLALTGGIIGLILGYITSVTLDQKGINLNFWKEAFGEMGFSAIIYPEIEFQLIVFTAIMVVITGIISEAIRSI